MFNGKKKEKKSFVVGQTFVGSRIIVQNNQHSHNFCDEGDLHGNVLHLT